jgi:hypothetical protein
MTIFILDADAIIVKGSSASLDMSKEGSCLYYSDYIFTRKMSNGLKARKSFPFDLEFASHVGDYFKLAEEVVD